MVFLMDYDIRNNCNAIIETASNTLISGCKTTVIPENITSIGKHAFNDCELLISITIPNSVKSIGEDLEDEVETKAQNWEEYIQECLDSGDYKLIIISN